MPLPRRTGASPARRPSGAQGATTLPIGRIVFTRSGSWWVAEFPSFPGAYSQGKTQAEAYRNLLSAVRDLVETYLAEARGNVTAVARMIRNAGATRPARAQQPSRAAAYRRS
jgi:predicted RNase H-like HicB family nuclease